jgi:hypothetical protein
MTRRPGRAAIRWGVPTLLIASCATAATVSSHTSRSDIPSAAFGSHLVLAVQLALIFFYGSLLLLVPAVRALEGDLPIELSLKGARWAEDFRGVEDELMVRQTDAEAEAVLADADRKEEIRLLGQELIRGDLALEILVRGALERIDALEEEGVGRGSRR